MEVFPRVIPQYRQRLEVDLVSIAGLVRVLGREIPIDASPDAVALRTDTDGFRDLDPAIVHDDDVALKFEDSLVGRRGCRNQQAEAGDEALHSTDPSLTGGTLATSSEAFWKNFRAAKPKIPATMLLGTVSVIVL